MSKLALSFPNPLDILIAALRGVTGSAVLEKNNTGNFVFLNPVSFVQGPLYTSEATEDQ
jgi:hypothetical protein